MPHDPAAHDQGTAEAGRDIGTGNPRFFSGGRGEWGRDLVETLRRRFGLEVVITSCFVTEALISFREGYNAAIEAHVDRVWGSGSLAQAVQEVMTRRKARYDAWVARLSAIKRVLAEEWVPIGYSIPDEKLDTYSVQIDQVLRGGASAEEVSQQLSRMATVAMRLREKTDEIDRRNERVARSLWKLSGG